MHYLIGYIDIFNPIFNHLPYIGIIGIALLFFLFNGKENEKKHVKIALFIYTLSIVTIIIFFSSDVGSGWVLEDNSHLKVKAYGTRNIQLSDAKIELVDSNGQWQLAHKRVGYNTVDLNIGFFYMKNGKSAMVFQHLTAPKKLLILANNEYIILSHPGIETLYNELLSRGVQKITQ